VQRKSEILVENQVPSRVIGPMHERIAAALGWTVKEAQSFSLASLREMVRPISPKLAHELTVAIETGKYLL